MIARWLLYHSLWCSPNQKERPSIIYKAFKDLECPKAYRFSKHQDVTDVRRLSTRTWSSAAQEYLTVCLVVLSQNGNTSMVGTQGLAALPDGSVPARLDHPTHTPQVIFGLEWRVDGIATTAMKGKQPTLYDGSRFWNSISPCESSWKHSISNDHSAREGMNPIQNKKQGIQKDYSSLSQVVKKPVGVKPELGTSRPQRWESFFQGFYI